MEAQAKQQVYTDGRRQWLHRYYATLDKPCGYYDLELVSSFKNVPDEKDLFPLTEKEWESRMDGTRMRDMAVIDGQWQDYQRLQVTLTLKDDARQALDQAKDQVLRTYTIFNRQTPDAWVRYMQALTDMVEGKDTTSTHLPQAP